MGYVTGMGGGKRCTQGFLWGNVSEGDHLEDRGVQDGLILKRFFGIVV
jgi:hypothetical protein